MPSPQKYGFEGSNILGANPILNDGWIVDCVSRLKPNVYDGSTLKLEKVIPIPVPDESTFNIKHIHVVDGSMLTGSKVQQTMSNVIKPLSFIILRKDIDFAVVPTETNVLNKLEQDSSRYQIMLPLKGLHFDNMTTFETLTTTIYEGMSRLTDVWDTYKWIMYKKWDEETETIGAKRIKDKGISLGCLYCLYKAKNNTKLEYDADKSSCNNCGHPIFITDLLVDTIYRKDGMSRIPSVYMNDFEILLLMNEIRKLWQDKTKRESISEHLFVKDGSLASMDDTFMASIRTFLSYAYNKGYEINVVSHEKTGNFSNHAINLQADDHLPNGHMFIPSDRYIKETILDRDLSTNINSEIYGYRHNIGTKVYVRFREGQTLVLNVPVKTTLTNKTQLDHFIGINSIITAIQEYGLIKKELKWVQWAHRLVAIPESSSDGLKRSFFPDKDVVIG